MTPPPSLYQVNLFNETQYENSIELYNSEFVEADLLIAKIQTNSSIQDIQRMYMSGCINTYLYVLNMF